MIVDANGCITLFAGVDGIPFYTVLVSLCSRKHLIVKSFPLRTIIVINLSRAIMCCMDIGVQQTLAELPMT